jgi:hypothetical protein
VLRGILWLGGTVLAPETAFFQQKIKNFPENFEKNGKFQKKK